LSTFRTAERRAIKETSNWWKKKLDVRKGETSSDKLRKRFEKRGEKSLVRGTGLKKTKGMENGEDQRKSQVKREGECRKRGEKGCKLVGGKNK